MNIFYLGPPGTFSEQVAKKFKEGLDQKIDLVDQPSFASVAQSLIKNKENSLGVMVYYNYLDGLVQETLDLIYENDLYIIDALRLPITFYAGIYPGFNPGKNTKIYSHPKGLAQITNWLMQNYPDALLRPVSSNSVAAQKVREKKEGIAVCGKKALIDNELEIIGEDIGNKKGGVQNFTDFYLVSKNDSVKTENEKEEDYFTMLAITPHFDQPGLLAEVLQQIAFYGLNNAKIHSRPAIDEVEIEGVLEPQMFYVEIMAHQNNEALKRCIDSLRYKLDPKSEDKNTVKILGCYKIQKP